MSTAYRRTEALRSPSKSKKQETIDEFNISNSDYSFGLQENLDSDQSLISEVNTKDLSDAGCAYARRWIDDPSSPAFISRDSRNSARPITELQSLSPLFGSFKTSQFGIQTTTYFFQKKNIDVDFLKPLFDSSKHQEDAQSGKNPQRRELSSRSRPACGQRSAIRDSKKQSFLKSPQSSIKEFKMKGAGDTIEKKTFFDSRISNQIESRQDHLKDNPSHLHLKSQVRDGKSSQLLSNEGQREKCTLTRIQKPSKVGFGNRAEQFMKQDTASLPPIRTRKFQNNKANFIQKLLEQKKNPQCQNKTKVIQNKLIQPSLF